MTGPFSRLATILEQNTTLGIVGPGGRSRTNRDRMSFNSDGSIMPAKPTLEGLQTAVAP